MKVKTYVGLIMIFVTLLLILKNFLLVAGWNAKIHVIAERRAVMAEWLTHLTKVVGVPGSSVSGSQL